MDTQQFELQKAQQEARAEEQAIRTARIAGVAAPRERVEPTLPATIRLGDPPLYGLFKLQARNDLVEEALTKLESGEVDTSESEATSLRELEGVGPELAEKLEGIGIQTPEELANADEDELTQIEGVGKAKAGKLIETASSATES